MSQILQTIHLSESCSVCFFHQANMIRKKTCFVSYLGPWFKITCAWGPIIFIIPLLSDVATWITSPFVKC